MSFRVTKLADLKRIPVGARLRLVDSLMGPCSKDRVVHAVKSNAIVFTDPNKPESRSWFYFPRASEFEATSDGFACFAWNDNSRTGETKRVLCMRYVYVD